MSNIGRTIQDFYCNGFFGRDYDLGGATIVGEGEEWLVVKKVDGMVVFGSFQSWDWNRHPDGSLSGGISNLENLSPDEIKKRINVWCGDE